MEGIWKKGEEPEVFKEVQKEVAALGDNTKALHEELRKEGETLRKLVDGLKSETDAAVVQQVQQLKTSIAAKQEALDNLNTKLTERMDSLETAIQSVPTDGKVDREDPVFKEAKAWKTELLARKNQLPVAGLSDADVNVEEFKNFNEAFQIYLRRGQMGDPGSIMTPEQQKMLSVGVEADGGIFVTPRMLNTVVGFLRETDPIRELAAVETTNTDSVEFLADMDDVTYGWASELTITSETTTPKWRKRLIPVHTLDARIHATQQVMEDASRDLEGWVAGKIADRFSRATGNAYVEGNGTDRPRGFLTYPNGTTAWGDVERTNLLHATLPTTDGLIRLKFSLLEGYMARATWVMNRLTVMETMLLKDGDGRYIWREGISAGTPSILLGLPTRMATSMPQVGAGALAYVLADWSQFYMVVDRRGITLQRDPYTQKPEIEYWSRARYGGDIKNFQSGKIGVIAP